MGAANVIEQRWSQRRTVSLDVDVFNGENLVANCRTRDVGLGGVFLEVADATLDTDDEVDLFFTLGGKKQVFRYKLKAKVVRMMSEGVGLMFKDFDTNSFRSLQEIMRYSATNAAV